jgi:hypothetical protein
MTLLITWLKRDDKTVIILNNFTLPNYFMQVPALINSDLPDPNTDGLMISVFDQILELAESFLLKGSIKVTHDFLHAFPKYWQYASDCNDCRGTGYQNGAQLALPVTEQEKDRSQKLVIRCF